VLPAFFCAHRGRQSPFTIQCASPPPFGRTKMRFYRNLGTGAGLGGSTTGVLGQPSEEECKRQSGDCSHRITRATPEGELATHSLLAHGSLADGERVSGSRRRFILLASFIAPSCSGSKRKLAGGFGPKCSVPGKRQPCRWLACWFLRTSCQRPPAKPEACKL
jgi:hypothetical protein